MNVLIVSLPGLRVLHLGCYGNEWVATPTFDRLAARGVVFDRHYADCPGLAAEFRPEWSGTFHHHVRNRANVSPRAAARPLRAILSEGGVVCAFPEDFPPPRAVASPWEEAFRRVAERARQMPTDAPWCLWAEAPSLAPPWRLPDDVLTAYFDDDEEAIPWAGPACGPIADDDEEYVRLQQTYAAVVTHVDGALEGFLDQWQDLPSSTETLLILTADRGLALGEHGIIGDHRPWLHDELVHLPLLLRLPNAVEAGRRVAAMTQPVDLYATILDALGLPLPESESVSLLPLALGRGHAGREFVCTSLRVGDALEWSLRTRDWAYLLPIQQGPNEPPRPPRLYAKPEDAWEVNDVRDRHQEWAEQLEQQLRTRVESVAQGERHEYREAGG